LGLLRNEQGVEAASPLPFACVRSSYSHLKAITTTAITLLNAAQTQSALQTFEKPVSFEWVGRPTQKLIGTVRRREPNVSFRREVRSEDASFDVSDSDAPFRPQWPEALGVQGAAPGGSFRRGKWVGSWADGFDAGAGESFGHP